MYDYVIERPADWLVLRPEVVVDPTIYRVGEVFLAGTPGTPGAPRTPGTQRADQLWDAVSKDVGGLVSFFDLLVLHERLPAFNYADTYDSALDFDDRLLNVVNSRTKVIDHVDVRYAAYMGSKTAALEALRHGTAGGSAALLPSTLQEGLAEELSTLEYQWNPGLAHLEPAFHGPARTAAGFLLGTLIFSAYAQQTGAPHVMSPKRSRLFTASALSAPRSSLAAEADLYSELNRRFHEAGEGWRDRELSWTPSFLPWLLQDVDPYRLRPLDVLEKVLDLREKKAVEEYRRTRTRALAGDEDAFAELTKLAEAMTRTLRVDRAELGETRNVLVELLPKAFGAAAGAALGVGAGPVGAALGAVLGVAGEDALQRVTGRVWGFVFEQLPFISARKLLTRAVRADYDTMARFENDLRTIWQTPSPRSG